MKMNLAKLNKMKQQNEKIVCLTAYDAGMSSLVNQAGVDIILVGDSLAMVVQGHKTTLPVTIEHMLYHTQMVQRTNTNAWCIADMPFMADADLATALKSAAVLMKDGLADMVKLEGGGRVFKTITALTDLGVPVCAHLGLLPQQVAKHGYKITGRDELSAKKLLNEAQQIEQAGANMLVLECVPSALAKQITATLTIPVIGIGSGVDTDGQVLVVTDVLGLTEKAPKFAKNYLNPTAGSIQKALTNYVAEVRESKFPAKQHLID